MEGRWVIVLAEPEGLRWVLQHSRMAWAARSAKRASAIRPGDGVIVYAARAALRGSRSAEPRFLAVGEVATPVRRFPDPIEIGGRSYVSGCDLRFEVILQEELGVPVRPLIPQLGFIRRKDSWGQYFRSGLVRVPHEDFAVVARAMKERAGKESGSVQLLSRPKERPSRWPLPAILRVAETSLRAGDLASTPVWMVDPSSSISEARARMEDNGFDVAPLREAPIRRYVVRTELADEGAPSLECAMSVRC